MTRRPLVLFEERDTLGVLTLNRPRTRNRLDDELTPALIDELVQLRTGSLRGLIIAAAGTDFSVGTPSPRAGPVDLGAREAINQLARLPMPTIAAIRGRATGSGLELAIACDFRVVSREAQLAMPQVRQGRLPSAGGTQRLPRLIGRPKALEMIVLGTVIRGDEAVRLGLANTAVPTTEVETAATELAEGWRDMAPIAVRYAKEAIWTGIDLPLSHGMRMEMDLAILLQSTDDRWEGLAAYREKRQPSMRGT